MAEQPLAPENLSATGLPSARRGYDRKAVAALLEEAAHRWRELRDRHDELIAEIDRRGGIENLGRDLREIGERVAVILGEAQAAADGMRAHAAGESRSRLDEVAEEATGIIADAEATAFDWRRDAWLAAVDLLEQTGAAADEMVKRADADVLIIRARAEQDVHRHLAEARKEAADLLRAARAQGERLVAEAQHRADELESGVGAPPAAPEVRGSGWGVKVLGGEPRRRGGDPAVEIDPHHPAYGDVLAAEVSSLREKESHRSWPSGAPGPAGPPTPPDPPPVPSESPVGEHEASRLERAETAGPDPLPPEAPPETAAAESAPQQQMAEELAPTGAIDVPAAPAPGGPAGGPPGGVAGLEPTAVDEVGDLFDRLRRTDETPVVALVDDAASEAQPSEPGDPAASDGPTVPAGADPVEVRERLLLPVVNQAARAARREMVELQNRALDELRTLRRGAVWHPDAAGMAAAIRSVVAPVAAASVEAGGRGAVELGAAPSPDPVSPDRALGMIERMAAEVEASVAGVASAAEPAAEAARRFRGWRNDGIERWVRAAAYAGYHDGLLAGLAAAGITEVVAVPHGRPCRQCPAGTAVVWDPAAGSPPGYAVPPADPGCGCTVQPQR